jgi:hypothetical protein
MKRLGSLLVALTSIVVFGCSKAAPPENKGVTVTAPGVNIQANPGGVSVNAPGVDVKSGPGGATINVTPPK